MFFPITLPDRYLEEFTHAFRNAFPDSKTDVSTTLGFGIRVPDEREASVLAFFEQFCVANNLTHLFVRQGEEGFELHEVGEFTAKDDFEIV